MKEPLIALPMFLSELVDVIVSMKRIQKFIQTDEVQKDIVKVLPEPIDGNAIKLKGSFSWGMRIKEKDDEETPDSETKVQEESKALIDEE
jgi:hypothetical protein